MTKLCLDYTGVLSAWEKAGAGNIFSSDDAKLLEDPMSITLDLSGWEASLNLSSIKSESSTDIFAGGVFSAAEMGLSFMPGHDASWSNQVVPSCGTQSDMESAASGLDMGSMEVKQEPTCPATTGAACSPASSSEAGVVPDAGVGGAVTSSTATSSCSFGVVPDAQALAPAGSVPTAPAGAAAASTPSTAASGPVPLPAPAAAAALAAASKPAEEPFVRTRAECLERYREKRSRRLYTKKIRYQLRKINADKRPRIKGRFVKKEELEEFLKTAKAGGDDEEDECMYSDDE